MSFITSCFGCGRKRPSDFESTNQSSESSDQTSTSRFCPRKRTVEGSSEHLTAQIASLEAELRTTLEWLKITDHDISYAEKRIHERKNDIEKRIVSYEADRNKIDLENEELRKVAKKVDDQLRTALKNSKELEDENASLRSEAINLRIARNRRSVAAWNELNNGSSAADSKGNNADTYLP